MKTQLTETEISTLKEIATSQYRGGDLSEPVWDFAAGKGFINGKQYSGGVSSLKRKKLVGTQRGEGGEEGQVWLTQSGVEAYEEVK